MREYATVLRTPGASLPAAASLIARLPVAMGSMSLLIYIQRTTGTFAEAGAVGGGALLGLAFGSVIQGRLIDRFGATRMLSVAVACFLVVAVANFAAIETHASLPVLLAAAFAFGVTQPAVATASRGVWGHLIPPGRLREAAFTYEAISLEMFFILGPGIAGILAALPWAGTGLLVTTILFIVGTTAFAWTPAIRRWQPGRAPGTPAAGLLGVVRARGAQTLLVLVLGLGLVFGFAEVAIPAWTTLEGVPELAGVLLGVWALSGVVFGVLYAARPWPKRLDVRGPVLLATFAVLVSFTALAPSLAWLALGLVISGTLITPQSTLHSLLVERVAPEGTAAEAFGWVITAVTLGVGVGQAISGQIVELLGPHAALALTAVPGLLAAGVAWLRRRTIAEPPGVTTAS